ncbi:MAG TPA: hypothetical protein VIL65_13380 [Beijerinckiaceae bacterium]|jgi:hypothetical protein
MLKHAVIVAGTLVLAAPAFAQTTVIVPAPSAPAAVPFADPGSPLEANSGPSSTGSIAPSGTGADRISNNAAQDGNAEQSARPVPNAGSQRSGDNGSSSSR